eukprot:3219737-Prymnesium_polylepis.1
MMLTPDTLTSAASRMASLSPPRLSLWAPSANSNKILLALSRDPSPLTTDTACSSPREMDVKLPAGL